MTDVMGVARLKKATKNSRKIPIRGPALVAKGVYFRKTFGGESILMNDDLVRNITCVSYLDLRKRTSINFPATTNDLIVPSSSQDGTYISFQQPQNTNSYVSVLL